VRALCLIVHAAAGGGRAGARLPAVRRALEARGAPLRVARTRGLAHAAELAREAAGRGEVAVAFGGDGLAGAVAGALRGTPGLLGLLPGGRGNDFARALGLPGDPVAACAALTAGAVRTVDVGEVDGRTFLGIASLGLDSRVGELANRSRVRSRATYLAATVRALARWRAAELGFAADGAPRRAVRGYSVAACNSGVFGGGMRLAPDARLDDGLLDVVVVHDAPRARFLALLPRVFRGTHVRLPEVELLRARELRVDAEPPLPIYADGDPIATTPATIRAVPAALRVLVA
jgi:YegS/Rv2252/BmrU family lipid kinase